MHDKSHGITDPSQLAVPKARWPIKVGGVPSTGLCKGKAKRQSDASLAMGLDAAAQSGFVATADVELDSFNRLGANCPLLSLHAHPSSDRAP